MAMEDDILRMSKGEREAFEKVYRSSWSKVFRFTGFFLRDEKEREDLVQEVFVNLWLKRKSVNLDKDYDAFLYIITRNLVVDRLRRKGTSVQVETLEGCMEVKLPEIEDSMDAEMMRKRVSILVELLPSRQKQVFLLRRDEGLSIAEIASKLGITESGVKRSLNLALKFLKTNLPLFLLFLDNF